MDQNTTQTKPKRHCMVVLAYYPWAETRVQREAESLVAQGYEVDVICLKQGKRPTRFCYRGVEVYGLPVKLKKDNFLIQFLNYLHFFVLAAIKLTQLHLRRPYDVIQVHNLPDFLVFCALLPKLKGTPIILDLHDLMPEFYTSRIGPDKYAWLGKLIRWQERLACRFADHVITVSEHWRQTLIQRGVPAHKCSVIMNVADEKFFHPPTDSNHRPVPTSDFRLIYHGTVVQRYGLDLAIQAIDQLRRDIPHIHLTILGGGNYMGVLKEMVRELDLDEHVALCGLRPAEELPEIILKANLGVVPYRNDVFTDGLLPTKLMEYAVLGLPAIAARTTTIKAYFTDTMVEFFEPGDVDDLARCIRQLYFNRERLAELAQGAQKFTQRYNWAQISLEYVALVYRLGQR